MQGRADVQMDRHVLVKDLAKAGKALKMPLDTLDKPLALFSVYDGHVGPKCSEFCAQNFHKKLLPKLAKVSRQREQTIEQQISASLRAAVVDLDQEFITKFRTDRSGCCAQIGLVVGRRLYLAGLGVVQAVLFSQVEDDAMSAWTSEVLHGIHLASDPKEQERVKLAGGTVVDVTPGLQHVGSKDYERQMRDFRMHSATGMGGGLTPPASSPITRSLGDRDLKVPQPIVSNEPEVRVVLLQRHHRALALVCDGILDVMQQRDIGIMMETHVGTENTCAGDLVQEAYNRGSEQNVTAITLFFRWPQKRTHEKAFCSGLDIKQDPPKEVRVDPVISSEDPVQALKKRRCEQQAKRAQEAKTEATQKKVTEQAHRIEPVVAGLSEEKLAHQGLAEAQALFQDEDGDVAHEFWEEAIVSGNLTLRKVVSGITKLG